MKLKKLVAIFKKPYYSLSIIVFLILGRNAIPWEFLKIEKNRAVIIAFLIVLIVILSSKNKVERTIRVHLLLINLIPLFLFGFSLLYTSSPNYGLYKFLFFILWGVLPSISILIIWDYNVIKSNWFIITVITIGWFTIFNLIFYSELTDQSRLVYGDVNSIWVGRMLGLASIGYFFLLMNTKNKKSGVKYAIFFSVFTIGILLTGSKGPIIALFLSLIFYISISKKISLYKLTSLSIFLLVLSSLYLLYNKGGIQRITNPQEFAFSINSRITLMNDGVKAWLDKPLLGQGLGGYSSFTSGLDQMQYPHNMLLELVSELGLFGLLIFIGILILFFISFNNILLIEDYELKNKILVYPIVFVYYLLNSMISGDFVGNIDIWVCLSIIVLVNLSLSNLCDNQFIER